MLAGSVTLAAQTIRITANPAPQAGSHPPGVTTRTDGAHRFAGQAQDQTSRAPVALCPVNVTLSTGAYGTSMNASFTPPSGLTLIAAANACGFTGFDWVQTITQWPGPSGLFAASNLTTSISIPPLAAMSDPPSGGYTYTVSQTPPFLGAYPFYYNPASLSLDCAEYSSAGSCLENIISSPNTLNFFDAPQNPCLPGGAFLGIPTICQGGLNGAASMAFTTSLVGICGSAPSPGCSSPGMPSTPLYQWTWTSNFNGSAGADSGGTVSASSYRPDAGTGSGGVAITSINGVQLTATLGVSSTHVGSFYQGQSTGAYIIQVQNNGLGATNGTVSATDTLPAALTASAIGGPGWTCVLATLTCSRSDILQAGSSYPPITVTIGVSASAPSQVTNQVSASGGGSPTATASDLTTVLAPFSDVNPSDAFLPAIDLMREYTITSGCGANPPAYCPADNITRSQMAVFIVRAIMGGDNFTFTTTPYFSDVPASDPTFQWVQKMRDLGITSGCSATSYCPDEPVTRDQMAVFIIRARYGATATFIHPRIPYFGDVPFGSLFFPWIQKMSQTGISLGCGPNLYCPSASVTRGEMAVFIMRGAFNQLLPPTIPVVIWVSPGSLSPGNLALATIVGQNMNFTSGLQVSAGDGITVNYITVVNSTTLTAQFAVAPGATLGPRSITVTIGSDEATLPNCFRVQ
jgi:hypothetical protein